MFPCSILRFDKASYLFNCCDGTQRNALEQGIKFPKIKCIFFNSSKIDCYLGTYGFLMSRGEMNINKAYQLAKNLVEKEKNVSKPILNHINTQNKGNDIFSEIQSPLSNFETQSYNQENTIYKLQNEILNLKAENEIFKKKLGELDKYKSEAAEARALKEQIEQLSPLREQLAEMASLKAQLAELNELKMKVKELENLRGQLEQTNNKKKKKFKSLGKKTKKEIKKEEKNINNMKGNTNINVNHSNTALNNNISEEELLEHQRFNKYCSDLIDNAMNKYN